MSARHWLIIALTAIGLAACSNNSNVIPASGTPTGNQTLSSDLVAQLMVPNPLGDMTLGDPKAPNTIIEYASLTCPHCQAWHGEVYPQLKTKYIDTGKVYFILREFPRDQLDTVAWMVARCIPNRFFPLVDLMFDQQANWAYVQDPKTALQNLVKQAGIGQDQFNGCLTNQSLLDGVQGSLSRATKTFGVGATPTFFINGVKAEGEQPLNAIEKRLIGLTT